MTSKPLPPVYIAFTQNPVDVLGNSRRDPAEDLTDSFVSADSNEATLRKAAIESMQGGSFPNDVVYICEMRVLACIKPKRVIEVEVHELPRHEAPLKWQGFPFDEAMQIARHYPMKRACWGEAHVKHARSPAGPAIPSVHVYVYVYMTPSSSEVYEPTVADKLASDWEFCSPEVAKLYWAKMAEDKTLMNHADENGV